MKRALIATMVLLSLFAGVCYAATYWSYGQQVQGQWTRGQSYLRVDTNASDSRITNVRAYALTEVAWDQMAWGVYITCYTPDNQVLCNKNVPLTSRPEEILFFQEYATFSGDIAKQSLIVESFHRSAESIHSPLFRAEVIMSTVERSFTTSGQSQMYALVNGARVTVPKYDMELLKKKVAMAVSASNCIISSNEIQEVLEGKVTIPGWTLDQVKVALYELHAYEASQLTFGDSRPVYAFDVNGFIVTIGYMRPDGSLKLGCVNINENVLIKELLDNKTFGAEL